jgi:hypothetical protein
MWQILRYVSGGSINTSEISLFLVDVEVYNAAFMLWCTTMISMILYAYLLPLWRHAYGVQLL